MSEVGFDAQSFLILFLKVSPIIFSLSVRFVAVNYNSKWNDIWKRYKGEKELTEELQAWRFHNLSLYLHDRSNVKNHSQLSLVILILLHLLLVVQQRVLLLLLPAAILVFYALLAERIITAFYRMDSDGRNPERYEKYYYDKTGIGDEDYGAFKNGFLSQRVDQLLSPPHASIVIEFLILINVTILEFVLVIFPEQVRTMLGVSNLGLSATFISIVICFLILIISLLVFPTKIQLIGDWKSETVADEEEEPS